MTDLDMQRGLWTKPIAFVSLFLSLASIFILAIKSSTSEVQPSVIVRINSNSSGTVVTDRPHFRVVILVLSSDIGRLVQNCRKVWHQYMHRHPDVKVFLVYGNSFHGTPLENDLIFSDIEEVYNPGMLQKTLRAMEYIEEHYSYDFLLRTNIGTFWNFPNLMKHLDALPLRNCYSGDGPFEETYLSGTDTIVNRHMIQGFIMHQEELDYGVDEDKAMGLIFHGVLGAPFRKSRIFFMEDFLTSDKRLIVQAIQEGLKNDADHYRVKNYRADRNVVDLACYIHLCHEIYGLNISHLEWTADGNASSLSPSRLLSDDPFRSDRN